MPPGFSSLGTNQEFNVWRGLPFSDRSYGLVYCEHFIEHLDRREGMRLLREIRRVLKPGGILRLAMPDRAASTENQKGYYIQDELRQAAENVGLSFDGLCEPEEEASADARLILEFSKPDRLLAPDAVPLVSIAIPAYNPSYFEKALKSALSQTWKHTEIIVSDDCPDDGIEKIVEKFKSDSRIRYLRNPKARGRGGLDNFVHCFEISRGEFIKFLNDDDMLAPNCVERFLDCFRKYPDITLAFSKRTLINKHDEVLPDRGDSGLLAREDRVFDGSALISDVILSEKGFIGEPTTVLFRKREVRSNQAHWMAFAGHDQITVVADQAAWTSLLSAGNAAYVASPLSYFRIHAGQAQRTQGINNLAAINYPLLIEGAYRFGLLYLEQGFPLVLPENTPESGFSKLVLQLVDQKRPLWKVYDGIGDHARKEQLPYALDSYRAAKSWAGVPVPENLKLVELLIESELYAEATKVLDVYLERFPNDASALEWREKAEWLKKEKTISPCTQADYMRWRDRFQDDPLFETLHRERVQSLWKKFPLFEFFLLLKPGQESLLADSIDSLSRQYYDGWRLGIFAQAPSPEPEFMNLESTVRWIQCSPDEIAASINNRLMESPANWFGLFACGTQFAPEMLLTLGDYIAIRPQWRIIYTDDDLVSRDEKFHFPRFKSDFNLEFLRSTDYIGGFCIEKSVLMAAGGFSTIAGAEHYDLFLRAVDAQVNGEAVGHIPEVLVHFPFSEPQALSARNEGAIRALHDHLQRRNIPAEVLPGLVEGETRHVVYLHEKKPKVSIIISTRKRLDLPCPCIETLLKTTAYPDYELLIVDDDNDDPDFSSYYDTLCKQASGRVRILHVPGAFDFSAMNNHAARQAQGEYLLFLNNDIECIHDDWLDEMMSHAQRPDVGIVGARLLFPDSLKIRHAGLILGMKGCAGHVFRDMPSEAPAYMHRTLTDQDYSAVTGACLLIRASVFREIDGFDSLLKNQYQDVDLCLKVRKASYRVIWTPFATLLHHDLESTAIQQECNDEFGEFSLRWKQQLSNDPAWNRHLSLDSLTPRLEKELRVPWNPDFHERPRVLSLLPASSAPGEFRGSEALRALNKQGSMHYASSVVQRMPSLSELGRLAPDVLHIHLPFTGAHTQVLWQCQKFFPEILRICSLNELISQIPGNHPEYSQVPLDEMTQIIRTDLTACSRLIVSTEPLAQAYKNMIDDIRLISDEKGLNQWLDAFTKPAVGIPLGG
ncbi:hypothetical protein FACS1894158_14070 [Betaproteobacteria bacterium]|nr:hypothetical protein FACS1894158_14070 [Betaproteobacteria bacterium]